MIYFGKCDSKSASPDYTCADEVEINKILTTYPLLTLKFKVDLK
jgi:hypothetical protein